jgi:putative GTP pyrophosphokinase
MSDEDPRSIQLAYDRERPSWDEALDRLAREFGTRLEGLGVRHQLRRRVKSLPSLLERARRKERINDLLGLRVVVPFQEDIERVVGLLESEWDAVQVERKAEGLSFREFGYDSVHVLVPLGTRLGQELPWNCRNVFEVQVRTILQDAWAEVEHEVVYKSPLRVPMESVRKKLAALNALLTLADMTFQEIREQQTALAEWGRKRFHELKRKAAEPDPPTLEPPLARSAEDALPPLSFRAGSELERVLLDGLMAHGKQDHEAAIALYSRALELRPAPSLRSIIHSHRGMAHFSRSEEGHALRDFEEAVRWDASNHRALVYRALALRRLGQVEEALLDLERALEAGAERSEVLYLRAQTLAEMERRDEAIAALTEVLQLEPGREEARKLLERLRPD